MAAGGAGLEPQADAPAATGLSGSYAPRIGRKLPAPGPTGTGGPVNPRGGGSAIPRPAHFGVKSDGLLAELDLPECFARDCPASDLPQLVPEFGGLPHFATLKKGATVSHNALK